jgi:hypothetical protein
VNELGTLLLSAPDDAIKLLLYSDHVFGTAHLLLSLAVTFAVVCWYRREPSI